MPELQTFRRTLMRWRREILAFFASGLTNGRTEGFNNKAKLTMRKSYGFRSQRIIQLALYHNLAALPEPNVTHRFW